jgi:hypothetical protein
MKRAILTALIVASCVGPQHAATASPKSPSPSPSPVFASPSPSLTPSPPAQRTEVSLPVALEESAAAAAGGKLFVMGGFDAAGNSLQTVWVFDGSAWSAGPRLPIGLDHTSAATLDDHVYLAGGHSFGRDSTRLFRLDGGSWTELAQMHHARGGHALLSAAGRLYAIGGNTAFANVAPAEIYDPSSNAWTDLPSLPAPRNHVSGFVFGANVCVAGGRSPATTRVDCFNFESSSWVRLPDLPRATSGAGATTLDAGNAVILGGENAQETTISNQFARLPNPDGWAPAEAMLVPRHGFELANFEGRGWACGGGSLPGLHPVATCTSVL